MAKLREMLKDNEINSGTLVAIAGGDDWLPLSSFPAIMVAPQMTELKTPVQTFSSSADAQCRQVGTAETAQLIKDPSVLLATIFPCLASLAVGSIVTWSIIGSETQKFREAQVKHEQEAQKDARAKQELALIVSECKRIEMVVSPIKSIRDIQAEQLRRRVQALENWTDYHTGHPQMEVARSLRVSLESAASRIDETTSDIGRSLANDRLLDAQREAVDAFAILTGMK